MLIPNWNAPKNIKAFTTLPRDPPFIMPFPIKQVHGARVIRLPYQQHLSMPEADAVFTAVPDIVCAIRTADCLPILVSNAAGTEVAAIHAGWKGLIAGVIEETFKQLHSSASHCIAWIGPAICGQCFEVGGEVRDAFMAKNTAFETAFSQGQEPKWLGNLALIASLILQDLGVEQISQSGICTFEDLRCNSYRREKQTDERMLTCISFNGSSSG